MIDVSDVLQDPDLVSTLVVTRTTKGVDDKGRSTGEETTFTVQGVVMPSTAEQLERLPEADRQGETIAFYALSQLTSGTDALGPDQVAWKGRTYRVSSIEDWTDHGYCLALCVLAGMHGKEVA